jgi:hypothetical protein
MPDPEKLKAKRIAARAKWRKSAAAKEQRKRWESRRPHRVRERQRKQKEKQASWPRPESCECCERTGLSLCFDHDHRTGLFRGWLCHRCNLVLGQIKDDLRLLHFMILYLKRADINNEYAWARGQIGDG